MRAAQQLILLSIPALPASIRCLACNSPLVTLDDLRAPCGEDQHRVSPAEYFILYGRTEQPVKSLKQESV